MPQINSIYIAFWGWVLAFLLASGFGFWGVMRSYHGGYESGQASQLEADRQKANVFFKINSPLSIEEIRGTVLTKNGSTLIFQSVDQPVNPLLDAYPVRREISLNNDTKIIRRVPKDPRKIREEMKQAQRQGGSYVFSSLEEIPAGSEEILLNQYISIVPAEKDSAYRQTLTAAKVIINP